MPNTSFCSLSGNRPELLAPAGDRDCVIAAVENGADAVYFGLDAGFNARARATNFDLDSLSETMDYLHRRCVKGYVTLNTLAFTDELPSLEELCRGLALVHVDAVLVQDLGAALLIKHSCPDLPLHASTQMSLTSAECIAVAEKLGVERVVLPRELSTKEIARIRDATDMPLEVFVHGALCVAYSGQCLTSESFGGRSANRGRCAQACRLPYDLVCDGRDVELGDQRYLLSPQDLAAFDLVTELIDAGVCSLKIEGRLKTPEYVANTVQHYRAAIDSAVAGRAQEFSKQQVNDLEMSFSRGLSPGWLNGCDHKMLVPATSSAKRGVLLGEIVSVSHDSVAVRLETSVSAGDGVVFEGDRENGREQGGRVYEIRQQGQLISASVGGGVVELAFGSDSVDCSDLYAGLKVWKTDDPRLNKRLRASFDGADARRRVNLKLSVTAVVGEKLKIIATAESGASCEVFSEGALEAARKHPLTEQTLIEQLGRLGGTIFSLSEVDSTITGGPMVPHSVFGKIRRKMIECLESAEVDTPTQVLDQHSLPRLRAQIASLDSLGDKSQKTQGFCNKLSVQCKSLQQLAEIVQHDISHVYVDFADIREFGEAVSMGREHGTELWLTTPRIQKPGEMGIFKAMAKHQPNGVLVRNLAGLAFFHEQQIPTVADFSLNVTNELTAEFLMNLGVRRVTASYDMNRNQLTEMAAQVPRDWLEVVIHQHMPMFHMEHCVFCSVLSPGTNKTNCGRPCDFHKVELRDRIGMEHPLTADVGCRNTLFNATPQSSAEVVPQLIELGLRNFRIELLNDDSEQIHKTVGLYQSLLNGTISGPEVWKQLKASNRVGVTRGTLEERRNPLAIL